MRAGRVALACSSTGEKDESWYVESGRAGIELGDAGQEALTRKSSPPLFPVPSGHGAPDHRARGHHDPRSLDVAARRHRPARGPVWTRRHQRRLTGSSAGRLRQRPRPRRAAARRRRRDGVPRGGTRGLAARADRGGPAGTRRLRRLAHRRPPPGARARGGRRQTRLPVPVVNQGMEPRPIPAAWDWGEVHKASLRVRRSLPRATRAGAHASRAVPSRLPRSTAPAAATARASPAGWRAGSPGGARRDRRGPCTERRELGASQRRMARGGARRAGARAAAPDLAAGRRSSSRCWRRSRSGGDPGYSSVQVPRRPPSTG